MGRRALGLLGSIALFVAACTDPPPPRSARGRGAGDAVGPARAKATTCAPVALVVDRSSGGVTTTAASNEDTRGWQPPPSLVVEAEPAAVTARTATFTVVARNQGDQPIVLYVLTGGEPAISTNPLGLAFPFALRGGPRPRLEVYPAPERVALPPGEWIRYRAELCFEQFETRPGPAVVGWSLELWSGRKPSGTVTVTIP